MEKQKNATASGTPETSTIKRYRAYYEAVVKAEKDKTRMKGEHE